MSSDNVVYCPSGRTTLLEVRGSTNKFALLSPKKASKVFGYLDDLTTVEYESVTKKLKTELLESEKTTWQQTVDSKFAALEARISTLNTQVSNLTAENYTLRQELNHVKQFCEEMGESLDNHSK